MRDSCTLGYKYNVIGIQQLTGGGNAKPSPRGRGKRRLQSTIMCELGGTHIQPTLVCICCVYGIMRTVHLVAVCIYGSWGVYIINKLFSLPRRHGRRQWTLRSRTRPKPEDPNLSEAEPDRSQNQKPVWSITSYEPTRPASSKLDTTATDIQRIYHQSYF